MTIDAIESESGGPFSLEGWLQSDQASLLQRDLEERILQALFCNNGTDSEFLGTAAQLAWIGSKPESRPLLQREIVRLYNDQELLLCRSSKKDKGVIHFIKEHKFEILAGIGLCATGFGLAAITGYGLGVSVGGATLIGVGSIFEEKDKPNPHIPRIAPPASKEEIALAQQPLPSSAPKIELPSSINELLITADGIWAGGQFYPNDSLMKQSIVAEELHRLAADQKNSHIPPTDRNVSPPHIYEESQAQETPGPQSVRPSRSIEMQPPISTPFTIPGANSRHSHIGWINGINNTFDESKASGAYLQELANGHAISGIYNCSHTPIVDLLEAALLNYNGYSIVTADLLVKEWKAFHEANPDRPNAKLLQICHSQGAIHVRNALENASQEIRERVIVVAIAPAAVVPDRLCFKSFNYASEKDIVHKFEPPPPRPIESINIDDVILPTFGDPLQDDRNELILLTPHPDAKGIDHELLSPTFADPLQKNLVDYHRRGGEYMPGEKGKTK